MRPISTTWWVRDGFGGNLTLNFRIEINLKEVFVGNNDLIRGTNHGIDFVLIIECKDCTKD